MSTNEEDVSKILSVLSHPLRRKILLHLSEEKNVSFTDFATTFGVDTGKLSFHLRTLEAFVEQTSAGKYKLSSLGRNSIALLRDLETWDTKIETPQKLLIRPLANGKERVAALLIDFLITFTLFLAFSNAFFPTTFRYTLDLNYTFYLVLFWGYSTLFERFRGQTLGKKLIRIKVVSIDGKDPSSDQAAIRNFGKTFLLPFDLISGLRQKDKRYMRYFDKFTKTTVIDLGLKTSSSISKKNETNKTSQS
jgi:uncharacterized RDD family membrane protein YckC/DNA-binding transcriptional ArsR family regulator